MSWNDLYSFRAALSVEEINTMRQRVIENISDLNLKRSTMLPNDFNLLMNTHQYALNLYNNMLNTRKVEQQDPYSSTHGCYKKNKNLLDPYEGKTTIFYNPDGTTKVVSESELCRTNEEWEAQFDPNLLLNPPSYIFPPSNVWRTDQVKKMGQPQRL